ncbi:FAD-dependent oxidoreductase [candidate division KSB1 bacterium]
MNKNNKQIAIIGAGLTGLGAAYKLLPGDFDVQIFEANDFVGGFAASIKYKDCTFDYGPHAFHASSKKMLQFFMDLMGDEVLILKKSVKISFQNKKYDYPMKPVNLLVNLNKKQLLSCMTSFLRQMVFPDNRSADKSLEQLYVSLYGRKLYELFFENYTEKVWGFHPNSLSNVFLKYRLPNKNLLQLGIQSILNSLGLQKRKLTKNNIIISQYYPKYGSGQFPLKLQEKIIKNGGNIHLNSTVSKIVLENNRIKEIVFNSNGKLHSHKSDIYITSIPITDIIRLIEPSVPDSIDKAASQLKYRAILIFCLVLDLDKILDSDYLYFHHQIFNRVGQMNSFSKAASPHGKTALTVEITCFPEDDIWNEDEENLLVKIIDGLGSEGYDIKDKIDGYFVLRSKYGYPIPTLNYEDSLIKLFKYLNSIPNLYVGGRQALFTYIQMFQALQMGFKIADSISENEIKPSFEKSTEKEFPLFV